MPETASASRSSAPRCGLSPRGAIASSRGPWTDRRLTGSLRFLHAKLYACCGLAQWPASLSPGASAACKPSHGQPPRRFPAVTLAFNRPCHCTTRTSGSAISATARDIGMPGSIIGTFQGMAIGTGMGLAYAQIDPKPDYSLRIAPLRLELAPSKVIDTCGYHPLAWPQRRCDRGGRLRKARQSSCTARPDITSFIVKRREPGPGVHDHPANTWNALMGDWDPSGATTTSANCEAP